MKKLLTIPAGATGCFNIQVEREGQGIDFVMRPAHEARGILHTFGPGSRAHRREGWRVVGIQPSACRTGELGRARRRRKRRK